MKSVKDLYFQNLISEYNCWVGWGEVEDEKEKEKEKEEKEERRRGRVKITYFVLLWYNS